MTKLFAVCFCLVAASSVSAQTDSKKQVPSEHVASFASLAVPATGGSSSSTLLPDLFTGSVGTEVQIDIPQGRHGLQPSIDLLYRNTVSNGVVGVGWTSEIGSIERSTKFGLDYQSDSYTYRTKGGLTDLVSVGPNEYRANIEGQFQRFTKFVGTDGYVAWAMTDKSGRIHSFGISASARISDPADGHRIFRWSLERVEDTHHNYMTFAYSSDQGQLYPTEADYTGNVSLSPVNSIRFAYETRPDIYQSFATGFSITTAKRLQYLEVFANSVRIRRYALGYVTSSATGRSLLSTVNTFSGDLTTSLPPTRFNYDDTSGWQTLSGGAGPQPALPVGNQCLTGDFNGNGKTEIACYTGSNGTWHVVILTPSGWQTLPGGAGPQPALPVGNQCLTGDFNGNGKTDIACYTGSNGTWHVVTLTPSGWQTLPGGAGPQPALPVGNQCLTGDFNGNGKTDIACYTGSNGAWHVVTLTASGWQTLSGGGGPQPAPPVGNQCLTGDFNGNGKSDIACYTGSNGAWHVVTLTPSGWQTLPGGAGPQPALPVYNQCLTGDFNGDGRTDISCYTGSNGAWHVVALTGSGWQTLAGGGGPQPAVPVYNQCLTGDFNGDGRTDISCYTGSNGAWHVVTLTASGWQTLPGGGGPQPGMPVGNQCLPGNFVGDARADLACYTGANGAWHVVTNSNISTNLMVTLTDPNGGISHLAYTPSSVYANTQLPFAIPLLGGITNDDGNGVVSSTQYTYSGGYYSSTERDFRGFASARTIGPTDGGPAVQRIEETFYHQGNETDIDKNDPTGAVGFMKGRPYRVRLTDGNGKLYAQVITTYRAGVAAPHFNPAIQIDTLTCDSGQCDKTVRNKYDYDEFGNITTETEYGDISDPGQARTIVRTFANNHSIWLLGLILSETTYAGAATDHLVSKTDYSYDGDNNCHNPAASPTPTVGDLTRVSPWTGSPTDIVDTLMGYDTFGNLVCKRDSMGAISHIAYDSSSTYITILTNALKQSSNTAYYEIDGPTNSAGYFGKVKSLTDPNGASSVFEYDGLGRITKQTEADGRWTSWSYVDFGDPTKQNIRTDSAAGLSSWNYFDGLGRPYLKKNTGPDQHLIAAQLHYNARGQTIAVSWPYLEGIGQPSYTTTSYDILDRALIITSPDGVLSRFCYSGWTSVSIDGNNHRIRYSKDAYGRLNLVEEYKGIFTGPCTTDEEVSSSNSQTGAKANHTNTLYTFDVRGNLISITDTNGNKSTIAYDLLNRRISVSDPNSGTIAFTYDKNGNVVSQKTASGKQIFLSYDVLNRVVQKDIGRAKHLGAGDVKYKYDGAGVFGKTRLYQVSTKGITKTFYYDSEGRVTSLRRKLDTHTFTTHWVFDTGDRLHSITYTSGDTVFYSYNGPFLDKIYDNNTVYARYEGYTAVGNPSVVTYGNGVTTQYVYGDSLSSTCSNKDSKLCSMSTATKGGQQIDDFKYNYDLAGNVRSVSSGEVTHSYVYDERNRLLAEGSSKASSGLATTYDDTDVADSAKDILNALAKRGPGVTWLKGYSYDDLGNMTWNSAVGDYSYNSLMAPDAVIKAGRSSYTYDKDGNMIAGDGRSMTYDSEGRLTGVLTASGATDLAYDEVGQRIKLTTRGVTTTYGGVLEECRANRCSRYVQAGDRVVAKISSDTDVNYYGLDYELSVVSITDSGGKIVGRLAYGAYGGLIASQGTSSNAKRYTSQEFDTSTGLYFYQSRYYDPVLARFVQPDTYVPFASNPQNLNRYAYALNNPATLTDPDGHCPICIAILIGAAIGGTEAAITHQNVWVGIARGAIIGAITGGAGDLVQGSSLLTQVGVESAAGAAAGSTNAVIFGGDVGQAAIFGAAFGAGSAFIGTVGLHPFDSSGTGALAAGAGIANELTTAGVEGAIIGGTFAGVSGRNILEGAESGASDWVVGELQNMAIGHAFGFLASGFGSPRWEKGAFKYDVSWMSNGWITFGNVISGGPSGPNGLDAPMDGANGTYRDHEMGHVRQGTLYGRYYPIAAGLSLIQGAGWALAKTYWTHENVIDGAHNYGALERGDNPYPAPIRGKDPE